MHSDSAPPICTVIVPVFNDPGYLADALESVRTQTVEDWEAIVVDDGSATDAACAVVERIGDPRIRIVRHEVNRGLSAARNTAISEARSEVIVPLDSDDMLQPTYLARVLPYLPPSGSYNCAFTDYQAFDGDDVVIRQGHGRHEGLVTYRPDELVSLLRFQWIPAGGASFTRSLWADVGGFYEGPELRIGNEDHDFWIGALEVGLHPVYLAEPLYGYRVGHASMMSRLRPESWKTYEIMYHRHRQIFDTTGQARGFLADGFVRSAEATRDLGRRADAMRLAFRALGHEPWRLDALGVIGRALLPAGVHDVLREARRRARRNAA